MGWNMKIGVYDVINDPLSRLQSFNSMDVNRQIYRG